MRGASWPTRGSTCGDGAVARCSSRPTTCRTGPSADEGADVEHRDELVRALAELSPQQRRVVVLRYLVGLSEREVADDLGVSTGTVKTQASRGLHRLRASMGELPGGSGD